MSSRPPDNTRRSTQRPQETDQCSIIAEPNTPRATAAIGQLCDVLNATSTIFADTNLKLHYTAKPPRPVDTNFEL